MLGAGVSTAQATRRLSVREAVSPVGNQRCTEVDARRQKSGVLVWFLIPEQERESERWDVPLPRPRAPSGQRTVFRAGLHAQLPREWGLQCFPCNTAVRFAGGAGSWVEASLHNGSLVSTGQASFVRPQKQPVKYEPPQQALLSIRALSQGLLTPSPALQPPARNTLMSSI